MERALRDERKIAVIDIGGTKTRFGVSQGLKESRLTNIITVPTFCRYSEFLMWVREVAQLYIGNLYAVGVSFGVGLFQGVVKASSKMPDFVDRKIAKDLDQVLKAPVSVHHDCVCVLAGLSQQLKNGETIGYVTISTGIGAAVVTRIEDFSFFQRIRIAHHVIDKRSQQRCACGRCGCLAVFGDATYWSSRGVNLKEVSDQAFWREYVDALSIGLANFSRMFGLNQLFIGGGVTRNLNLNENLVKAISDQLPVDGYQQTAINILPDEDLAPLYGACRVATLENAFYHEF